MIKQTKKFYNDAFIEIFSNIRFVKSLLQNFVHEPWVTLVDFSHMEVTKSQFTGISEDKREADLLLKFSIKENADIFIFILLEFQRTYEKMFLRLIDYMVKIYRNQDKNLFTLLARYITNLLHYKQIENKTIFEYFSEGRKSMLTESLEKIKQESFEQGIERGIEQGELVEKQNILIKLLSKKHGIEEEEEKYIRTITNLEKLDAALEKVLFSKDKKQVLDCLR